MKDQYYQSQWWKPVATIGATYFYDRYVRPHLKPKPKPHIGHYSKKNKRMAEDLPVGLAHKFGKFHTGLKPLRGVSKGHITYRDAWVDNANVATGYKYFRTVAYIGTSSQYLTATNNATASNRDSVSYAPFFSLNPEQGIAAGNIIGATSAPTNDKVGLTNCTMYFDVKNGLSSAMYFKIHVFMAETDLTRGPLYYYDQALTADSIYTTSYAFGVNAATLPATSGNEIDSAYGGSTTTVAEAMYTLPYTNISSKRLQRSTWKKIKTMSHAFSGSDQCRFTINGTLNQFGLRERLSSVASVYPKGCVAFVFESQGALAEDNTNSTYCHAAVVWHALINRKIHLAPCAIPNKRFESTYVGAGQQYQGQTAALTADLQYSTLSKQTVTNF